MKRAGTVAALILAMLTLVAGGATAGILLTPEPTPEILAAPEDFVDLEVTQVDFNDEQMVVVEPVSGESVVLSSIANGTITSSSCVRDAQFSSGSALFRVDDAPVIGLATSTPLYRDLWGGERGSDVAALNAELARLGYESGGSDTYTVETARGVRDLVASAAGYRPDGFLLLTDLVWMAQQTVVTEDCAIQVGEFFSGGEVASSVGGLSSARVPILPPNATPGERVVMIADARYPIDDNGIISAEGVAALSETEEYMNWARTEGAFDLKLPWQLKETLDASLVPPASLYGIQGGRGCVRTESGGLWATILGSQLGRSYVVFDAGVAPPSRVVTTPAPGETCR